MDCVPNSGTTLFLLASQQHKSLEYVTHPHHHHPTIAAGADSYEDTVKRARGHNKFVEWKELADGAK